MRKDKRCLDYHKVIRASEGKLLGLEKAQTKALLRDRMRFLRLLKSGECSSVAAAGKHIGLKLRASEKLWRKYREQGLAGLLDYPFQGYAGKLTLEQQDTLEQELQNSSFRGLTDSCHYVEQNFDTHYTLPGMHYVLKRLKAGKKTARPAHIHKSEKAEKQFKKKSFPA